MLRSMGIVIGFYTIQYNFCYWILPYLGMIYWTPASIVPAVVINQTCRFFYTVMIRLWWLDILCETKRKATFELRDVQFNTSLIFLSRLTGWDVSETGQIFNICCSMCQHTSYFCTVVVFFSNAYRLMSKSRWFCNIVDIANTRTYIM